MGDLAFNKDSGMLESDILHFVVELRQDVLIVQGFKLPTNISRMLVAIPSLTKQHWTFIHYCDEQLSAKMTAGKCDQPSLTNVLLAHTGLTQELLNLQSNSKTIIVAGIDTLAASLTHIFYLLTKHPDHVVKLRQGLLLLMNNDGIFKN